MIFPDFLKKGDTIGVTACSDGRTDELDLVRLDNAKQQLQKAGYDVIETANCRQSIKGRSSDAKTRVLQLNELLRNEKVTEIIMCSGGDYLMEILPLLNFDLFKDHPKWIQGYSDPTGLLYTLTTHLEMATVYGTNYGNFGMEKWHSSLEDNMRLLEGGWSRETGFVQHSFDQYVDGYHKKETGLEGYILEQNVLWKNLKSEEQIVMSGRMLGGCVDVLLYLVGTRYDKTKEFCQKYSEDGIVWYLESFDLNSERLYLGLWQMKETGWFDTAKGFIFGRPALYESSYDICYNETLLSALGELNVPIIFDADFGHKPPQMTIINGAIGEVISEQGAGSLTQRF